MRETGAVDAQANVVVKESDMVGTDVETQPQEAAQLTPQESAERMRRLFAEWIADETGYDEETWPQLKKRLDEDRLSDRKLFL